MARPVQGFSAGTVFGFPIYIEPSALYLGPWIFLFALTQASGTDLVRAIALVVIIVLSVLAHEIAHAIAARELGVPVRHIALTWFGGYAAFWAPPTHWRDAVIAFAGPAANLAIAATLSAALASMPDRGLELSGRFLVVNTEQDFFEDIMRIGAMVNLALGCLNLLPGLPLDGGHILRALLAMRMSWGRAGWIAAWAGIIIGAASIAYAIWVESFQFLFLGIFVGFSAWLERRALRYG